MKKLLFLILILFSVYGCGESKADITESDKILQKVYSTQQSDFQVQGSGVVIKILSDDLRGSKHQRFILKLETDQTLLISHNIDLAARIDELKTGDFVEFYGVYEWNSKGGVIHWTHDDPRDIHINGWLKHKGTIYR